MAMFKTLKDLQARVEKNSRGSGEGTQRFFKIEEGESYRIRFRQELTEDSEGYSEEAGVAQIIAVHNNPADFTKSARCTKDMEEYGYSCWACSQAPGEKGWYAKDHLVINVAVLNDEDGTWEPRVLDQKFTGAHVAESIVEFATEYGTLVDRDYKISRKGKKQQTQYTLTPLSIKEADETIANLPYHDVSKNFRVFAPADQTAYYLGGGNDGSGGAEAWK